MECVSHLLFDHVVQAQNVHEHQQLQHFHQLVAVLKALERHILYWQEILRLLELAVEKGHWETIAILERHLAAGEVDLLSRFYGVGQDELSL